ncbi:MAG: DegT/DnrJ/EryC1/StrS family aminotransferase [Candidatus Aenigmarchaeota archaeon]|nr:DegT/DnrJ/EryC1/StrS family aminotransferase [Candidatus Aenigmarchaeota archaeon]
MIIPCFDLSRQYDSIKEEVQKSVNDVFESGRFILGKNVEEFEREFSSYIGVKHGIGVGNGTDALHFALVASGVVLNDEVIVPSYTATPSVLAISHAGAKPVFVDIEPDSYCMDTSLVEKAITKKTKAIMPVHLYGHPVDMKAVMEIAEKHSLKVIEDASQAHGTEYRGKKVGCFGDAACFSFYPTKNLNAFGDGGLVTTNDDSLAEEIRVCASHGSKEKYKAAIIGVNSRLDAIQAACLSVKLKYIDKWNASRKEKAQTYNTLLADTGIVIPSGDTLKKSVFHQYSILVKNRDKLQEYLKSKGISTMIYYPIPLHLQEAYSYLNYKKGDFPVTEKAAEDIISLPMFPELTTEEIKIITNEIKTFLNVALPL